MKNLFLDFDSVSIKKRGTPLERIVPTKEQAVDRMIEGCLNLVEAAAKELACFEENRPGFKVYPAAIETIQGLQYDPEDIEDFCAELDNSDRIILTLSELVGIYLSALINHSKKDRIVLRLWDYRKSFHFLGYGLPEGKTLIIQGEVGDFIGAGLSGGRLVVEGSTGDWCGAGMKRGRILVTERTGQRTGEWMRGGEIRVDGRILSIGKTLLGGQIYQQGEIMTPAGH